MMMMMMNVCITSCNVIFVSYTNKNVYTHRRIQSHSFRFNYTAGCHRQKTSSAPGSTKVLQSRFGRWKPRKNPCCILFVYVYCSLNQKLEHPCDGLLAFLIPNFFVFLSYLIISSLHPVHYHPNSPLAPVFCLLFCNPVCQPFHPTVVTCHLDVSDLASFHELDTHSCAILIRVI